MRQVGHLSFEGLIFIHTHLGSKGLKDVDVVDNLSALLLPSSDSFESLRVVKYSPRFRLAFSLLNEDASSGRAVLSWDVKGAIERKCWLVIRVVLSTNDTQAICRRLSGNCRFCTTSLLRVKCNTMHLWLSVLSRCNMENRQPMALRRNI